MKTDFHCWCIGLHFVTLSLFSSAQEWTRFRGPNGTGISAAKSIPTKWAERDFNWKVALPGSGHASPVLWGDKIFLISTDEPSQKLLVHCHQISDGALLWQKDFSQAPYAMHKFNSFASPTPAVDKERVYVAWQSLGHYKFMALDHSGKMVWERDLGAFESQHASGTSPIVYQDKVILWKDPDGDSFVLAVDAKTGQTRWQTPRRGSRADYSTPCFYQLKGEKPLLIFNSLEDGVSALDPDTGKVAWEIDKVFDKRSVSSPVIASGLIIGSCGSGGGGNYVAAVRPGDPSKNQKPEVAYEIRQSAPYVPTAMSVGDLLFLWSDGGIVTCLHAPTGKVRWQERAGGNFFASPICVDGRLFGISTAGEVVVLEASDKFRELARNPLNEPTHATPAIAGGRMYLRTLRHLISVGGKAAIP